MSDHCNESVPAKSTAACPDKSRTRALDDDDDDDDDARPPITHHDSEREEQVLT